LFCNIHVRGGLISVLYCVKIIIIGKDFEGSSRGLIEVLSRHFAGGTEENTENLIQNNQCPGRKSTREPPEYKHRLLPLYHPNKYFLYN
jgi:hypothetical protein